MGCRGGCRPQPTPPPALLAGITADPLWRAWSAETLQHPCPQQSCSGHGSCPQPQHQAAARRLLAALSATPAWGFKDPHTLHPLAGHVGRSLPEAWPQHDRQAGFRKDQVTLRELLLLWHPAQ
jgi:hypothetical protein